ncbi:DNA/RNA non-specific endonuclease [Corallococcus praedator]|uniref:DNA/RNA non-specific endonuclease n=1 Tax=Corallococcus praedator TaxID=2316724 RepID=A0ABX9Q6V4_9BACT|nr:MULTISPECIES: DNA/RNA non-specific endonuclease [Corallococcus]RKH12349.1 DNA/RNA non-specific endonuclease [Corallococcus sp. CA047B]RKH27379.1 DNA/RNA non-specific endonuclease [Corallococcus sp. CA031C]RKH89245.1 DNA/RNA non-specific endonuclease [Corallococcus praedator]
MSLRIPTRATPPRPTPANASDTAAAPANTAVPAAPVPGNAAPASAVPSNTVVAPSGGSWKRSATKEVAISDLQQKFGWTDESWQGRLLKAADAGGVDGRGENGQVSAAELETYLSAPTDAQFLTSTAIQQQRAALDAKLAGGAQSVSVDAFDSPWQASVAKRADLLGGNADGQLSAEELTAYVNASKANQAKGTGTAADTQWVPDQQMATFQSRVAEVAGELDPLRPVGGEGATPGLNLVKEYSRTLLDTDKNVPTFVSYMLSAADVKETPADVSRLNSTFVRDPEVGVGGVTDSDYNNTGFDRGHMKAAEDSPTQAAMNESHYMSNIAPQHGNHNQQVWRTLERGVSELVKETGGKAYIVTGNLYLDDKGKPLPPESIETMGAKDRKMAVPTHNFKTVLLELPNGNLSMFAYMVPNAKEGPSKKDEIVPMLEASRVPVDQLEGLLGQDLYAQLPKGVQEKLEKDASAAGIFQQESLYESATLLRAPPSA